ncbi:MAG TPA: hypothetical protein VG963_08020, partial [Polyangiaceae bacterium]|nr:hypothetical protein [Polyangiaceae bacterium]
MTTSSGKPPLDEQALDSSWDAMGADAPPSEDGPVDTPQFVRPVPAANAKKNSERPMYGAGVPYGGDDRTEEVEP